MHSMAHVPGNAHQATDAAVLTRAVRDPRVSNVALGVLFTLPDRPWIDPNSGADPRSRHDPPPEIRACVAELRTLGYLP